MKPRYIKLHHLGVCRALHDVRTTTKLPNDAFLGLHRVLKRQVTPPWPISVLSHPQGWLLSAERGALYSQLHVISRFQRFPASLGFSLQSCGFEGKGRGLIDFILYNRTQHKVEAFSVEWIKLRLTSQSLGIFGHHLINTLLNQLS